MRLAVGIAVILLAGCAGAAAPEHPAYRWASKSWQGPKDAEHPLVDPGRHALLPPVPRRADKAAPTKPRIFIAVISHATDVEARQAARGAFATQLRALKTGPSNPEVRYKFFVGAHGANPSKLRAAQAEGARHGGDVVVLPAAADGYENLVNKVTAAMRWASTHEKADWVVKLDTDAALDVGRLWHKMRASKLPKTGAFAGQVVPAGFPPVRDKNHKWHLPAAEYDKESMPRYCSGPCYIMSMDAAAYVGRYRDLTAEFPFRLEDVFMGGVLSQIGVRARSIGSGAFLQNLGEATVGRIKSAAAIHALKDPLRSFPIVADIRASKHSSRTALARLKRIEEASITELHTLNRAVLAHMETTGHGPSAEWRRQLDGDDDDGNYGATLASGPSGPAVDLDGICEKAVNGEDTEFKEWEDAGVECEDHFNDVCNVPFPGGFNPKLRQGYPIECGITSTPCTDAEFGALAACGDAKLTEAEQQQCGLGVQFDGSLSDGCVACLRVAGDDAGTKCAPGATEGPTEAPTDEATDGPTEEPTHDHDHCPDGSDPDRNDNCLCPAGTMCYHREATRCGYSQTGGGRSWHSINCEQCQCRPMVKPTEEPTDGTVRPPVVGTDAPTQPPARKPAVVSVKLSASAAGGLTGSNAQAAVDAAEAEVRKQAPKGATVSTKIQTKTALKMSFSGTEPLTTSQVDAVTRIVEATACAGATGACKVVVAARRRLRRKLADSQTLNFEVVRDWSPKELEALGEGKVLASASVDRQTLKKKLSKSPKLGLDKRVSAVSAKVEAELVVEILPASGDDDEIDVDVSATATAVAKGAGIKPEDVAVTYAPPPTEAPATEEPTERPTYSGTLLPPLPTFAPRPTSAPTEAIWLKMLNSDQYKKECQPLVDTDMWCDFFRNYYCGTAFHGFCANDKSADLQTCASITKRSAQCDGIEYVYVVSGGVKATAPSWLAAVFVALALAFN